MIALPNSKRRAKREPEARKGQQKKTQMESIHLNASYTRRSGTMKRSSKILKNWKRKSKLIQSFMRTKNKRRKWLEEKLSKEKLAK